MPDQPFSAYEGNAPYFFVSYAHEDAAAVYAEMAWIHGAGFRLWYDDGIHVGSRWRDALADALAESRALIFFATTRSVVSDNCSKEINFALAEDKPVIVVSLDEVELPRALRLSLSDRQTLRRSEFDLPTYRARLTAGLGNLVLPEPGGTTAVATALPPASLEKNDADVFIVCTSVDDEPLALDQRGWITEFGRQLELRMQQLSGERVRISVNLLSDTTPSSQSGLPVLSTAKAMIAVVTPSFVRSDSARQMVEAFWQEAERSGGIWVGDQPRLYKVLKTPTPREAVPGTLDALFSQVRGFEFYEEFPDSGRVVEFDERVDEYRPRYYERVYDVAQDVHRTLSSIKSRSQDASPAVASKTIYLAASSSDQHNACERLRREFVARGYRVVPERPLPLIRAELERAVSEYLAESELAIHPIGSSYGLIPEDAERSIIEIQNDLAAEASRQSGLKRILWLAADLSGASEQHRAFVTRLKENPDDHLGADVVQDSLENVKAIALEHLAKAEKPVPDRSGTAPRVYLICDQQDEAAAEELEDFLFDQGFEVSLPDFDADEAQAAESHRQNLLDCDAVIVFYGAARHAWVDVKLRTLLKARGYGREEDIAAQAVYIAPPFDRRKERFRTHNAEVLRQSDDQPTAELLQSFVSRLREAG